MEQLIIEGSSDPRGDHLSHITVLAGDIRVEVTTLGHPLRLPIPNRPHSDTQSLNLTVGQALDLARASRALAHPGVTTSVIADPGTNVWQVQGTNPDGVVIAKRVPVSQVPERVILATTIADPIRFERAAHAMSTSLGGDCAATLSVDGAGIGSGLSVHAEGPGIKWAIRMIGLRPSG